MVYSGSWCLVAIEPEFIAAMRVFVAQERPHLFTYISDSLMMAML